MPGITGRISADGYFRSWKTVWFALIALKASATGCERIQIPVKAREVTAGDFKTDAVTGRKDIARNAGIDGHLIRRVSFDEGGGAQGEAVAEASDPVGDEARRSRGRHVDELGGEVRVVGGCRHVSKARTGPVTSRSSRSGADVYTRTSERRSTLD